MRGPRFSFTLPTLKKSSTTSTDAPTFKAVAAELLAALSTLAAERSS
jgi:hypothetical protein